MFFSKVKCQELQEEPKKQQQHEPQALVKSLSGRQIAAAAVNPGESCEFASLQYFGLCGIGGILSCGITHTMVVPLDLVKCRIQVDPVKYKSIFNGFKVTLAEDGMRGLAKGWAPTFFGYSAQGLCKFGFYEVFKL
ncbi:mitochondrial carrier protein [Oryctes borbonicus]|uniref:Mitochondrial carrier protein n=1 Tax=Oryctes borbonicus TaxID=1629725 RepID=A0A0T6BBC2_9SCAR|nr:mitochondrial carrier protein [Oryctes borbonicus]